MDQIVCGDQVPSCGHAFWGLLDDVEVVDARVDVVHRDYGPRHVDDLFS
jgi:hypothetical protein